MKKIIKGRWVILAIWIIVTILLAAFQPDINAILRFRGTTALDKNSPSVMADSILNKMDTTKGNNDIIIFYNKGKITNTEMNQISVGVKAIADSSTELGISNMIDPFSMPEAKSSLFSKDGTTLMVSFKLDKGNREIDDIKKELDSKLTNIKTEYYFSGADFINNDYLKSAEKGVQSSAVLTVVFILLILILMFRSVVIPLVSLIAVAFSYLCSFGIVAQLIDKANFPVTNLTQMLIILILFGIGTDYNILLFNRFKEELSQGYSVDDAIVNTYKTAGKTIVFSILTVFIAFLTLIFAESPIYRSGAYVAISVTILLLEILTLTPFVMKLLGKKLFWPSKKMGGHGENKFWGKSSTFASKHPIISVMVVLLIIVPTIYLHQQKLNFNTIGELGDSQPSAKGFSLIAEHFGKGQAMPSTIVIENKRALDNNESLAVVDNITERVKNIKGVNQVSSVTQPQGKQIDNFYIGNQIKSVTEGLAATEDGLNKIYGGLQQAQGGSESSKSSGASQMVNGLKQISDGLGATNDFLTQLDTNKAFFIPKEALTNANFKKSLDSFMTRDRTITKMIVVLKDDPYSSKALDTIEQIKETVSNGLKGSALSDAKSGVSGPSAMTNDMNNVLGRDLNKATVIVLIGVFLVLLLVIRSFWEPLVITASLMGSYYAAMFVINFIFINLKGYEGISSFVPFFAFIVIVALGVDYSIFLMMRFKEYPHMSHQEAIVLASKHTGGIVMSAALILGGTFATLMPSGILLLIELATAVIIGLVVLCFILLPVFLPAMIALPHALRNYGIKSMDSEDIMVEEETV